jgi:hypothetical protein
LAFHPKGGMWIVSANRVLKRIVGYRRERVIKEHRKNNNNNEN